MWTLLIRSRHAWLIGLSTGLVGIFLLLGPGIGMWGGSNAWAEPAPSAPVAQQRVRELEQRVKILELEHEALDRRMRLETERTGRTIEALDMRIRALEASHRAADEAAATPPEKSAAVDEFCKDPYIRFSNGIRRVKSGCEDMAKPCDAPEVVDARGVWSVRPECVPLTAPKAGGCDMPYVIDPKGIKQFKPECL